jgi:hypothetical protein
VRTAHLYGAALLSLAVLATAPAVPVLSPLLCLAALMLTGELAVRVLVREPLTAPAHLGLVPVAGLISLPALALALHTLGVPIGGRGLAAGLAVLGGVLSLGAHRRVRSSTGTRATIVAVVVPAGLALLIGGAATVAYQRLPHPAEPGFTSLALAGWAAAIDRPVTIPAAGLDVPVEVGGAGERPSRLALSVEIGARPTGPARPVTITGGTQPIRVHVPAPPAGCLYPVRISLGPASTVFYARAASSPATPGRLAPGRVAPGRVAPGRVAPGGFAAGSVAPGGFVPGRVAPGGVRPGRVGPGRVVGGRGRGAGSGSRGAAC